MAPASRSAWYQALAYAGTRSRNRPPNSFQTGTPSDCPIKSQHATSNAASADCVTSPSRPYSPRCTFHASRSTSNGSDPITYRGASSSMHATSVSVLLTIRTSPTPVNPVSVVNSRNTSSRHGAPTTVIRASRIFTRRRLAQTELGARLGRGGLPGGPERAAPRVPRAFSFPCSAKGAETEGGNGVHKRSDGDNRGRTEGEHRPTCLRFGARRTSSPLVLR